MRSISLFLVLALAAAFNTPAHAEDDLPPNATPGKCYAKCLAPDVWETTTEQVLETEGKTKLRTIPATYRKESERILVREASTKLVTIPPVYETLTERVLAREASTKLVSVPATYENQTETITVREPSSKLVVVPARYRTETERVLVTAEQTKWVRKKSAACLREDPKDCLIMCLETIPAVYKTMKRTVLDRPAETRTVEVPGVYKTITRKVVKTPATTRAVEIPAKYKTVTRKVVKTPATSREVVIPAVYKTVTRTVVDEAPRTEESSTPARYQNLTKRVLVKKGGYSEWREILCDSEITSNRIGRIQQALVDKGYNIGPKGVDGVIGKATLAALKKFQKDNNLPVGNLDRETMRALGVE